MKVEIFKITLRINSSSYNRFTLERFHMNRYKLLVENERRILTSVKRIIREAKLTDAEKAEREAEKIRKRAEKEAEKARIKAEKEAKKANRLTAAESEDVIVHMWNTAAKGKEIPKEYADRGLEPLFNSVKPYAKSKATVYGKKKLSTSDLWKDVTGKDKDTSKTDVIGDRNYSVKYGPAQLMSGAPEEARATLVAAAEKSGLSKEAQKKADNFLTDLKLYALRTVGETMNLQAIRSLGDKEAITNQLNQRAYDFVKKGEELQKGLQEEMQKLFDSSPAFEQEFIYEAMTGATKFSDATAIADTMLCIDKDATSIKIESVSDSSSPYVKKVMSATSIKASYKGSSYELKTGVKGFTFQTALRLITKDLSKATNECIAAVNSYQGSVLNENFFDFVKKAWEKLKSVVEKIKQFIVKAIEHIKAGFVKLLQFFGIDFDVQGWEKLDTIDLYDVA